MAFDIIRIGNNRILNRTNSLASRMIIITNTFSTFIWINFISIKPHEIASFGHSGSHISQLIHFSVIFNAIAIISLTSKKIGAIITQSPIIPNTDLHCYHMIIKIFAKNFEERGFFKTKFSTKTS